MLEIKGLSVAYRGAPALREVSLSVPDGSVVALLGGNGAGKTTLLRAV
ncbi:ATP-binding cassette domain-containing protein, partial [Actinomadura adrarensis]